MNKTLKTLPTFLNGRGIGFDRMLSAFDNELAFPTNNAYPPYNLIQVTDDDFMVELALAGFAIDDIEITQDGNKLKIDGKKPSIDGEQPTYLHQGISARSFKREFLLAEHVTVEDADFGNGILTIKLHRELPESMKPRTIDIVQISK